MSDIALQVKQLISNVLGIKLEDIKETSTFLGDLQTESLMLVELVMTFEDTFGGTISDEDLSKIVTVSDAIKFVEDFLSKKNNNK